MKNLKFLPFIIISILLISGCNKNRFKINTGKSDLKIHIERFDKDLYALDTNNISAGLPEIKSKYGDFFYRYAENIYLDSPDEPGFNENLRDFLTDPSVRVLYDESLEVFKNVSGIEKKLTVAFKYMEHYFPKSVIPKVYMHVSGFGDQVIITENALSVSIDNYLGADFIFYQDLAYGYELVSMTPEKVPSDYMRAWLLSEFPFFPYSDVLLDNMLYCGKIMFLLETVMQNEKEEILMGYTPEQLKWCYDNEKSMWVSIAEQKHLFLNDRMTTAKYINDAPFTTFFPKESPGRTGIWIGWQIIRSYMKNNKDVGLPELMRETDYRKILEKSGYRP